LFIFKYLFIFFILFLSIINASNSKKIAYIVNDTTIPFWEIMSKGITNKANFLNYQIVIYDAKNKKEELEFTIKAIKEEVDGIIISPSDSSACTTVLKLANKANIPVVISDVGSDSKDYISYISSNNKEGAYNIGKILSTKMYELNKQDGSVGIIAIPQKRLNGQERTAGFIQALNEANIKGANIKQLETWSPKETYTFTKEFISDYPNLKAIWLQTSNTYNGALQAIKDSKKEDEILLITFDAEPIFLDLIKNGTLLGSAMQQPYLMGQEAMSTMNKYLNNEKVEKNIEIPILIVSSKNIKQMLPIIKTNVLGIE